jgi:hypothetical protein
VSAQSKTKIVLAAAPPPPPPVDGEGLPAVRGEESGKRNIPKDHPFDPKALKPLARMLFSMSVSLGHALTAYKEFTKLKSVSISPDGMIGGRGYVMKVKDVRSNIQQACELISAVSDTIFDEINAPHWKPQLADLGENDAEDVTEFLEESKKILDDPEGYGEKEVEEIEEKNDGKDGKPATPNDKPNKHERFDKPEGSKVPGAGDPDVQFRGDPTGKENGKRTKEASIEDSPAHRLVLAFKLANSSLPVSTLPGGPRVEHLGPGEEVLPWGDGENVLDTRYSFEAWGESAVPDANSEPTETDANDFGLGYGADGSGIKVPRTWGPSAELPDDPGGSGSGGTEYVEQTHKNVFASAPWGDEPALDAEGSSGLPNDGDEPVARSDYYPGDKGNQFNVSVRADAGWGVDSESELPGNAVAPYDFDADETPNGGEVSEKQEIPYMKWDWTTHQYRGDGQVYSYDRTRNNG